VQIVESVAPRHPITTWVDSALIRLWQGRGLATAVMAPVLDICDREGRAAYLESSTESNVAFYSHRGFEVTGEVTVPEAALRLWLMWREPSRPTL